MTAYNGSEQDLFQMFTNDDSDAMHSFVDHTYDDLPQPQPNDELPAEMPNPAFESKAMLNQSQSNLELSINNPDFLFGEMQLDEQFDLDLYDFPSDELQVDISVNLQNSVTPLSVVHQTFQPPFMLDKPRSSLARSPPTSRFVPIQPAPRVMPNDIQDVRPEKTADHLDREIQQALQVVQNENRSTAVKGRNATGSFQMFRINKPHTTSRNTSTVKKQRLKRSLARSCLLCRLMKRSCTPDTPCARCVEKSLGQRDLAFRSCVRESALDFNPFAVDDPEDSDQSILGSPHYIRVIYLHSKAEGHRTTRFLRWLLFELTSEISGRNNFQEKPIDISSLTSMRTMQHWVSHHLLRTLEMVFRPTEVGPNTNKLYQRCLGIALQFLAFLKAFNGEDVLNGKSQAADTCVRYLTEYIVLLLQRIFSHGIHSPIDKIDEITVLLITDGPRTDFKILHDAYKLSGELFSAVSSQVEVPLDAGFETLSWSSDPDWPLDYPDLEDQMQILGIWSLFWRALPKARLQWFDYSETDFLLPLLEYGTGLNGNAELPRRTWAQWDTKANLFRKLVASGFLTQDVAQLLGGEARQLAQCAGFWDFSFLDETRMEQGSSSYELAGYFRLAVCFSLWRMDLIRADGLQLFLVDVITSKHNSTWARFRPGLPLFWKVFGTVENKYSL